MSGWDVNFGNLPRTTKCWERGLVNVVQNLIFDKINSTSIEDIVLGLQVESSSPIKQSFKT